MLKNWFCPNFLSLPKISELPKVWGGCSPPRPPGAYACSRRVRSHQKNSGDAVWRLGTIIQSIFCAQSRGSIRLNVWKWSGESRYPGALPPALETFRDAFSLDPTDYPWLGLREWGTPVTSTQLITFNTLNMPNSRTALFLSSFRVIAHDGY